VKSAEEIMQIPEAYGFTGSYRDAAELAGVLITLSRTGCRHVRRVGDAGVRAAAADAD
jgi:hypothetical protein